MRRRRQSGDNDSLDMLLDTITNAFGGIVLLALLVALQVGRVAPERQSASPAAQDDHADRQRLAMELADLEQSIESKRRRLGLFEQPGIADLISQLQAEEKEVVRLSARLRELEQQSAGMVEATNRTGRERDEIQAQSRELQEQIAGTTEKIVRERAARSRNMETPRERSTSRQMAGVFLKGNEMFVLNRNAGAGQFECNRDHFEACPDRRQADVVLSLPAGAWRARQGRGVPLDNVEGVREQLSRIPSGRVYVALVVWPDSFDHFQNVRDACVQLGLEHKVLPIQAGPVFEGPSAGGATAQ